RPLPPAPSAEEGLDAVIAAQQAAAQAEALGHHVRSLRSLAAALERQHSGLRACAEALFELGIDYDREQQAFRLSRRADQAFLDRHGLEELVRAAAPACVDEVRRRCAGVLDGEAGPAGLRADVRESVARHARPFARLAAPEEARRAAGERGRL